MSMSYPPVAFHFQLTFNDKSGKVMASFKEVSGVSMEMGVEEIAEGGNNRYIHRVPTAAKFSNLILKRGLVPKDSGVVKWCRTTLGGGLADFIEAKNIIVSLLDGAHEPISTWSFFNAWPVKWSISDLNSMNNEIVIETLEFAYSYFEEQPK